MKIEFENANELMLKLDAVENINLTKPFARVGNDIEVQAKENCNGRFEEPTGTLKRSIRAQLIPNGVEVGTNLEYAQRLGRQVVHDIRRKAETVPHPCIQQQKVQHPKIHQGGIR